MPSSLSALDAAPSSPVTLRRAVAADADLLAAWRAEPSVGRYQPLRPRPVAELWAGLAEQAERTVDPRLAGDVQWIVETGDGPVGWLSLKDISREHGYGAVGYTIGERHRGRGYATAAVRALLPLALSPAGADLWRLEAIAAVANVASCRVLERAGFRCEGIARALLVIAGERVDHARYGLLRPEWEADRTWSLAVAPRERSGPRG